MAANLSIKQRMTQVSVARFQKTLWTNFTKKLAKNSQNWQKPVAKNSQVKTNEKH